MFYFDAERVNRFQIRTRRQRRQLRKSIFVQSLVSLFAVNESRLKSCVIYVNAGSLRISCRLHDCTSQLRNYRRPFLKMSARADSEPEPTVYDAEFYF